MRIVFLCNEYPPHESVSGIGVFARTIAHGLVACGHRVTVLGYGKNCGEWDDNGVRVCILPKSTARGVAWFVNRRRLYSWLKQQALAGYIDVIEIPEYQGMLPWKFPWCPVVVRLHTAFRPASIIQYYLEKKTLKMHRNWIAVSLSIKHETIEKFNITPMKVSVVYNPVDNFTNNVVVPFFLPDDYVIYAGTVSDRKGAFVLAKAARSFLAEHPDLHLVYVGELTLENGRRADETILQILGEEFQSRVCFTGPVEHDIVLACMRRAKVLAFPSKLEAFGLVALEAMSCDVPVVYSTLHAGPEIIDDGLTGLLANPHSPGDVAEKVLRILNDPAFGAQLATNAKQAVKERFSLQRCLDNTVAFYTGILQEQRNGYRDRWQHHA